MLPTASYRSLARQPPQRLLHVVWGSSAWNIWGQNSGDMFGQIDLWNTVLQKQSCFDFSTCWESGGAYQKITEWQIQAIVGDGDDSWDDHPLRILTAKITTCRKPLLPDKLNQKGRGRWDEGAEEVAAIRGDQGNILWSFRWGLYWSRTSEEKKFGWGWVWSWIFLPKGQPEVDQGQQQQ